MLAMNVGDWLPACCSVRLSWSLDVSEAVGVCRSKVVPMKERERGTDDPYFLHPSVLKKRIHVSLVRNLAFLNFYEN
jgi:hypothetical protein